MTFVIMLTDRIPDMARFGVSMRYFVPRYRKKDQKKCSTPVSKHAFSSAPVDFFHKPTSTLLVCAGCARGDVK
jgi:hypothetical protein